MENKEIKELEVIGAEVENEIIIVDSVLVVEYEKMSDEEILGLIEKLSEEKEEIRKEYNEVYGRWKDVNSKIRELGRIKRDRGIGSVEGKRGLNDRQDKIRKELGKLKGEQRIKVYNKLFLERFVGKGVWTGERLMKSSNSYYWCLDVSRLFYEEKGEMVIKLKNGSVVNFEKLVK